jgi:hypothetical protein
MAFCLSNVASSLRNVRRRGGGKANQGSQCGDAREALRLCQALLRDLERVLGPDHPNTLSTRSNIADWTGQCGDARETLRLYKDPFAPSSVKVMIRS